MFIAPLQVDFDITMKCMYQCKHCNVAAGDQMNDEMTTEQIKHVIDQLDELGVSDVSITGGEPLLRNDCLEILSYAASKEGFMLTLNTNGLLITKEVISFLEEYCPNINVCVSLDGYDPKSYSILRRKKDSNDEILEKEFLRVTEALELLAKSKLSCGVNYTVTKATIPNFYKTYDFIRNIGIDAMLAIKFFPYGFGRENRSELEMNYDIWRDFLNEMTAKKKDKYYDGLQLSITCPWEVYLPTLENGYEISDVHTLYHYNSPLESELYRKKRNIGCHAGITSCAISPNGDLYPCGTISTKFPPFICGNLKEESLSEIWANSSVLKELRALDINNLEGNCKTCKIGSLCGGGCRARAYTEFNNLNAIDYLCPIVK